MPAWERGDIDTLRKCASANLKILLPFVERGAKVIAINPTCSMMMRREHPTLVEPADRPAAEKDRGSRYGSERIPVVDSQRAAVQH